MRTALDSGFVFWGLFLVFGIIVGAYLFWMRWVEKNAAPPDLPHPPLKAP